jgi:uncharacterized protein (TIGR02246 family)
MRKTFVVFTLFLLYSLTAFSQTAADETGVRSLIQQWNAAYLKLDAKALAALNTPEFDIVNRLGQWTHKSSNADQEKLWTWTFEFIYRGKPGVDHQIEKVRFHTPEVASVLTRGYWKDELTLDDGTKIPPHGEVDTFTVVKKNGKWKVAWIDIHNQMPPFDVKPGEPLETVFPPPPGSGPK